MNKKIICNQLRIGDKSSIDQLYKLYHKKIFAFSLSYLKNEQLAYDVVQDVFVKIWENRKQIKNHEGVDSLLFITAKNILISMFRKKASEKSYLKYLKDTVVNIGEDTNETIDYNFLNQYYEELISELPEKRKQIFILSRKSGLSNREIAQKLKISEKTVENQMTKALAYFRNNFSKSGFVYTLYFSLFIN
jgi:RNA polymerase sigma-70 factor (ECF subfamily)